MDDKGFAWMRFFGGFLLIEILETGLCEILNAVAVESFKSCEWLEQPCLSNQGGVRIILDYTHSWYQCCMATAVWDDTHKTRQCDFICTPCETTCESLSILHCRPWFKIKR